MYPNIDKVIVASGTGDAAAVAASTFLRLVGFSAAESAGTAAAAEVILRHGTADTDELLVAPINLAANGFQAEMFGAGIPAPNGIFVDRVSGTTTLVLYVARA